MGNKRLYTLDISEDSLIDKPRRSSVQRKLEQTGTLGQGPAQVSSITTQPGEFLLAGQIRGAADDLEQIMAAEIEGLFDSSGITVVPFYDVEVDTEQDGYYSMENISTTPADPRAQGETKFDGTLVREGTPKSHFRIVRTNVDPVTNDFGSGATPPVAIPSRARRVRWQDRVTKETESASPTTTLATEFGDLDRYALSDASLSNDLALVYELPLQFDGSVDPRVWDDINRTKRVAPFDTVDATVGGATVGGQNLSAEPTVVPNRWRRVFRTSHRFRGSAIVENGLLRLAFDEADERLRAYRWNDTAHHWDRVPLGDSNWRLDDLDLRRIGDDRVEALTTWRDFRAGQTAQLRLSLQRGFEDALWTRPSGASQTPSGLQTRLDPVAADYTDDPTPDKDLIARSEVE